MPDIRADFSEAVAVGPGQMTWSALPQPGVDRVLLDRLGDEVAVATSLVRYAPGSRFPAHEHPLGEELLVLEGEFADEYGRYARGSYLRNPPGSGHAPFSEPGCVLWVKLRQFHLDDQNRLLLDLDDPIPQTGVAARDLHRHDDEAVRLLCAAPDTVIALDPAQRVQEVLVMSGAVAWGNRDLGPWGWLRVPPDAGLELEVRTPTRLLHKARPARSVVAR